MFLCKRVAGRFGIELELRIKKDCNKYSKQENEVLEGNIIRSEVIAFLKKNKKDDEGHISVPNKETTLRFFCSGIQTWWQ